MKNNYPKLIFYTIKEKYKYEEIESSEEEYEELKGYEPTKFQRGYDDWKNMIQQRNFENKQMDGKEQILIQKCAVSSRYNEEDMRNKIQLESNFYSWIETNET
jgi:hypothetical protein